MRYSSSAAMARAERAGSAAPERTLHDWAIESIRHSEFVAALPSGVPSSKRPDGTSRHPRRGAPATPPAPPFGPPAPVSTTLFSSTTSATAKPDRTCAGTSPARRSPPALTPTRFIASFQSPVPMSGRPWLPPQGARRRRHNARTPWPLRPGTGARNTSPPDRAQLRAFEIRNRLPPEALKSPVTAI